MSFLKQSTAYTRMFLMIDSTDHITGKTGLTPTVTISKAGGAFGAVGGTVTEVSSGWYKIAFNTTDTNTLGDLAVHCTSAGADATDFVDRVIAFDLDVATVVTASGTVTTVSGNVNGSVGSVTGSVGSVTGLTAANLDAAITTRATPAQVQTSVAAELDAAGSELAAVPTTVGSLRQKIYFMFQYFRNRRSVTSGTETMYKEDATTVLGTATISDNGTTFEHGEVN